MAEKQFTTEQAEKRVESIKDHLKSLKHASDFLYDLANFKTECEMDPVELSVETICYFGSIMGLAVDTIAAELGLLEYAGRPHAEAYVRRPQAAPEGGAV